MIINDSHCHFFSPNFFRILTRDKFGTVTGQNLDRVTRTLGWEKPDTVEDLANRWIQELDRQGVTRVALMASAPSDEDSVSAAVRLYPGRIVGFFMVDPTAEDAEKRIERFIYEKGLKCVCLFPAMHHYHLQDDRVRRLARVLSSKTGTALFVHCGALSVGARKKLGLADSFDLTYSNPLNLHTVAMEFRQLPIIIPHFGAGMFKEALMVADLCPNVFLDTSSSNGWIKYHPGLDLKAAFSQALQVVGSDRLLFGTDSSFFPRGWVKQVWESQCRILKELDLSIEDQEKIFGGNFERLFPRP